MAETWVVDMSHWNYRDDEAYKFPAKTLKFWGYFGSIVAATLAKPRSQPSTGLSCRRRPRRKICNGVIESEIIPPGNSLRWWCPICGDNGQISNWEGTRWAPTNRLTVIPFPRSGRVFETESAPSLRLPQPQIIEGIIERDEEQEGDLPKIVTAQKAYTLEELGRELITHEGFAIKIRIG